MSRIEELKGKIASVNQEREKVQAETAEKRSETNACAERRANQKSLEQKAADLERDNATLSDNIEKMNKEINELPSETQVLKLERKVESLKEQLKEAEGTIDEHRTGIEAYRARCKNCNETVSSLIAKETEVAVDANGSAEEQEAVDAKLKSHADISASLDTMMQMCDERENELKDLNEQFAKKTDEEQALTQKIRDLQEKGERELPQVDAEADRQLDAITKAWKKEQAELTKIYDSLVQINKEQVYHLQRGTNVKSLATEPTLKHEEALSLRQSQLANQILETEAEIKVLKDNNGYKKRLLDKAAVDGKKAKAAFEEELKKCQVRLDNVISERIEAEKEVEDLKATKGELHKQIQLLRDTEN